MYYKHKNHALTIPSTSNMCSNIATCFDFTQKLHGSVDPFSPSKLTFVVAVDSINEFLNFFESLVTAINSGQRNTTYMYKGSHFKIPLTNDNFVYRTGVLQPIMRWIKRVRVIVLTGSSDLLVRTSIVFNIIISLLAEVSTRKKRDLCRHPFSVAFSVAFSDVNTR